jgi:hypothetical protein
MQPMKEKCNSYFSALLARMDQRPIGFYLPTGLDLAEPDEIGRNWTRRLAMDKTRTVRQAFRKSTLKKGAF